MSRRPVHALALLGAFSACGSRTLDAGSDHPQGLLPVDERNPIILSNDGPRDNWDGEFAMTMASLGTIELVGIIVNSSPVYPTLEDNVQGWRDMVAAARASGMRGVPDPTASVDGTLQRPSDGDIDATPPNHTEGARLIIDTAHRLSQPLRPIVVATGGRLTEVADAYLLDPDIVDQVVVVASLGHAAGDGSSSALSTPNTATLSAPNGPIDPWADEIVARKFRYVQVNAYYEQQGDIPSARASELPANAFGAWMTSKLGDILPQTDAADQLSVIAPALPAFAHGVTRMVEASATPPPAGGSPTLVAAANGNAWVVTSGDNALATSRFWQALTDPVAYGGAVPAHP